MKKKEFITSVIFFIILVFVYAIFPVKDNFQNVITSVVFFVFLPVLYIKLILKKTITEFGIKIGDIKKGITYSFVSLLVFMLIIFIVIRYTQFINNYILPLDVVHNFGSFLLYEGFWVLLFVGMYDFLFRGFVYFSCEKEFGLWAILLQTILFLMLVLFDGSFKWIFLPYIIFAPFAGIIVYKSRSLIYSIATQFIAIVLLDVYFIHSIR